MSHTSLSWQAFEYEYREKSADWYWALGIIAVTGAIAAVILNNILFAVLIIVGSFFLAVFAARRPPLVQFEVSSRGVRINTILYPHVSLATFWIIERAHGPAKLLVKSKKPLSPLISLPIADTISLDALRELLSEHLDEEELEEPFMHTLMEFLGF
jgi:hypothetical protein